MAPARTGKLVIKRMAVTEMAQSMRGMRSREITFVVREQMIVVRKLMLPRIEEIPAK